MSLALAGAKNAAIDELAEIIKLSDASRDALEKLNIREILGLTKDIRLAFRAS